MESIVSVKLPYEDIGERLKECRLLAENKLSQSAMAEEIGMNSSVAYGHHERGRSQIGRNELLKFCEATGAHPNYIMTGKEPKWQKDDLNALFNEEQRAKLARMDEDERELMFELFTHMKNYKKGNEG